MNRTILIMIGCLISSIMNGQNLKDHTWENRILIVKTHDAQSSKYQKQLKEFDNSVKGLNDRKLIVYQIIGSRYMLKDYGNSNQEETGELSSNLTKEILNEAYDFEIILIGLDGGVKLQKTEVVLKEELFSIIDSMPMRKSELKNSVRKN